VATRFNVSRAEFTFEAAYQRPEFTIFRDVTAFTGRLYSALEAHGIRLSDIKQERGEGTLADVHILVNLFEYAFSARIRLDRIDFICVNVTQENFARLGSAIVDVLGAVAVSGFRSYNFSMNLHGTLEGADVRAFLARFIAATPIGTWASPEAAIGNAIAYYYGPTEDRQLATLTLDISGAVPGALYVRPQATWDGTKIKPGDVPAIAERFVRETLESVGLQL
jgi:hypothetical protein